VPEHPETVAKFRSCAILRHGKHRLPSRPNSRPVIL
jgi:hypothetical protein